MKTKIFFIYFTLFSNIFSFAQSVEDFPKPCSVKMPKYGRDSATAVKNYAIYRENLAEWKKSKFTSDAINYLLDPWRYCFTHAPLISQNVFFDGLTIYEYFIKKEKDSIRRQKYIDTLLMIHDKNIEAFGCKKPYGEGYILGRKALDMYDYRPHELTKIYATLKRSVDLQKEEAEPAVLSLFYKVTIDMVRSKQLDTSFVYENYDLVSDLINKKFSQLNEEFSSPNADTAKLKKKIESLKIAETNTNNLFEPWATCEMIVKIYQPKLQKNVENADWLQRVVMLMAKKECTDNDLYFKAAEAWYKISPSPSSAMMLAKSYIKVKKYNEAIKYLSDAIPQLSDKDEKFNAYLTLASAYQSAGQYSNARSAAINASNLKPEDPMPYIIIGDLYMQTAASCGDNEVSKRAGYWAAYDKYMKAKSLTQDEKMLSSISQRISAAYANFPDNEKLFFYNLQPGTSYTINCWYSETTVVRAR